MIETIIAGVLAFAGTNIDDIFINTLFFAQADTGRKVRSVVIGKYLGIGALVLVSWFGAVFLQYVPQNYTALLGLVPMALGIREWIQYQKDKKSSDSSHEEEKPDVGRGFIISMMLITIASGGDNIGVYMPLFTGYSVWQMLTVVIIFALMTALWCLLGKKLSDLPGLRTFLLKYKHIIVPCVLIALGIYIIAKPFL
ncbi:MAG: cadmium resistance transporter [Clostridia bacterium]|nr:cadmium resistance transporter [Clostridia bacterium]